MLTYDLIAQWIEPVAENPEPNNAFAVKQLGDCKLILFDAWDAYDSPFNPKGQADLACAELVRRLNAAGYQVLFGSDEIEFYNGEGWFDSNPYTIHPLEAVAKFAARVLTKKRAGPRP